MPGLDSVYFFFVDDDEVMSSASPSSEPDTTSTLGDAAAAGVAGLLQQGEAIAGRQAGADGASFVPYLMGLLVCVFWFVMFMGTYDHEYKAPDEGQNNTGSRRWPRSG